MSSPPTMLAAEFDQPGLFPSREQELVLKAALLPDDTQAIEAYQQWRATLRIEDPFDREVFRLLPQMYDRLRQLGVQDNLSGRLKGAYRQAWVRNHRLFEDMRPVLAALSAAGIRVLVLKGAALAQGCYGNVALRPMEDIDLAVQVADLPRTRALLGTLGYRPMFPVDATAMRHRHATAMVDDQGRQIDLHWDVMYELAGPMANAWFWRNTEAIDCMGQRVETLEPTAMLLHTVVHGVRWNEEPPVRWIADAVMLLRRRGGEIDWNRLVALAAERQLHHRLALGLRYLCQWAAPQLPADIVDRLSGMPLDTLQRVERATILVDQRKLYRTTLGPMKLLVAFSARRSQGQAWHQRISALVGFARLHWGEGSWIKLALLLVRGLYTRLMRDPARAIQRRLVREV